MSDIWETQSTAHGERPDGELWEVRAVDGVSIIWRRPGPLLGAAREALSFIEGSAYFEEKFKSLRHAVEEAERS